MRLRRTFRLIQAIDADIFGMSMAFLGLHGVHYQRSDHGNLIPLKSMKRWLRSFKPNITLPPLS